MKKLLVLLLVLSVGKVSQSQTNTSTSDEAYSSGFEEAYKKFPSVPRGVLEAISYTKTRINHIDSTTPPSCIGLPRVYGVMGLTLNGKGYFRNNLITVSKLSGISIKEIIDNPQSNILAFASAYAVLKKKHGVTGQNIEQDVDIIKALSEIPDKSNLSDYPLNSYVYSVLILLTEPDFQKRFKTPSYKINFIKIFGDPNYKVLSAKKVFRYGITYKNEEGVLYINNYKK